MLLILWLTCIAVLSIVMLVVHLEPAQRLHTRRVGPRVLDLPKRTAWKLMSAIAVPSVLYFYAAHDGFSAHPVLSLSSLTLALYCTHYLYRSVVFPWRLRSSGTYSAVVVVCTWCYYVPMGYFLGSYLAGPPTPLFAASWPLFSLGLTLFVFGLASTVAHDAALIRLREGPSSEYRIPQWGLFRFSSNAHYLSELIEWLGLVLLTGALPAAAHFAAIFLLMVPQALRTHRWYHEYFGGEYPSRRAALIPFVL